MSRRLVVRVCSGDGADGIPLRGIVALFLLAGWAVPATDLRAQDGPSPVDSAAVLEDARTAQARFERLRVRFAPYSNWSGAGRCDDYVGRFCIRFGSDDADEDRPSWTPPPESPEVEEARDELIDTLAEAHRRIPGDRWVMGQWIVYLAEAGRWDAALEALEGCRVTGWWCAGLEGFVLHAQARTVQAERRFAEALAALTEEQRLRWTDPSPVVDARVQGELERLEGPEESFLRDRIWRLSDPLFLLPGNAVWSEHLARWVLTRTREDARNGHGMRWGDDMTELLVRYGPVVSYERLRAPLTHMGPPPVLGRYRDDARHMIPSAEAVWEPAASTPEDWETESRRARSRHAPPPARRIRGMEVQWARFRRGDDLLAVASWGLPAGWDRGSEEPAGEEGPSRGEGSSGPGLRAGLLLLDEVELEPKTARVFGHGAQGAAVGQVSSGAVLASVEVLDSVGRRAWRQRRGLALPRAPERGLHLSDPLVLQLSPEAALRVPDEGSSTPHSLDSLLARPHSGVDLQPGPVELVWEIYGLEGDDVPVEFDVRVGRVERGLLRRAGEALGILSPPSPVTLRWTERVDGEGPSGDRALRRVTLDLAGLDPGTWELSLSASGPGDAEDTVNRLIELQTAPSRPGVGGTPAEPAGSPPKPP